jgi:hypothetical protein
VILTWQMGQPLHCTEMLATSPKREQKNAMYLVHSTQHAMTLVPIELALGVRVTDGVKVLAVSRTLLVGSEGVAVVVHNTRAVVEVGTVIGADGALGGCGTATQPAPVLGGDEGDEKEREGKVETHGC